MLSVCGRYQITLTYKGYQRLVLYAVHRNLRPVASEEYETNSVFYIKLSWPGSGRLEDRTDAVQ